MLTFSKPWSLELVVTSKVWLLLKILASFMFSLAHFFILLFLIDIDHSCCFTLSIIKVLILAQSIFASFIWIFCTFPIALVKFRISINIFFSAGIKLIKNPY